MHEKEIEKLQAEKEKVERQLAQEQHKIQRLENRAAYYEKAGKTCALPLVDRADIILPFHWYLLTLKQL